MKPILTITLNPAIDKTMILDSCRVKNIADTAGGKGINVARTLKALGVPVICSGFLGGTNGRFIRKELDKEGIEQDFFKIAADTRVNLTVFDRASFKTTRTITAAPRITKKEIKSFFKKYEKLLKRSSFVVISGSGLGYVQLSPVLIRMAAEYSIPVALDTSGKELLSGLAAKPFLLKINWEEAKELLGKKLSLISEIKAGLRDIFNRGVKISVITCGFKGAWLFDGKEFIFVKPKKVKAKTTVGCGDAFLAGLVAAMLKGKRIYESAKIAAACGASAARSIVPGKINKVRL